MAPLRMMAAAGGLMLAIAPMPASGETLSEALVTAWRANPVLQAARANLRASGEGVDQAWGGWRPDVGLNGTYGWSRSTTDAATGTGTSLESREETSPWSANVRVSQTVFRGGQTLAGIRQARAAENVSRAALLDTEQQVLLDAVTAYFDVLYDAEVVMLNSRQVGVLGRQRQATQDRFAAGELTRTDVAQSEAAEASARSSLARTRAVLTGSRAAYQRIIGNAPGDLEGAPDLPDLPGSEGAAMRSALDLHPRLQMAKYAERASRHAVSAAEGALLPTLSVEGEYGYLGEPSAQIDRQRGSSVTGRLTVPLYQSGIARSQVRQALQVNSRDRLGVVQSRLQVEEGVRNGWEALRSARAQIDADRAQVSANESALRGVRQEADSGLRTILDVLDAEQVLLDSRVSLQQARRDEYVAAYALLAAMGRLNVSALELPVASSSPEAYHDSDGNSE